MSILLDLIERANRIAILGHVKPDGDCLGSTLGMWNYIEENYSGKEVQVYLESASDKFAYLNKFPLISQELDGDQCYDLCIGFDCGEVGRLGKYAIYLSNAKDSICVDHHITSSGFGNHNVIRGEDVSSTCEILFTLLEEDKISPIVAECIYTGIIHDTNVFKNSNTSAETMRIAGRLMGKGIPFGKIIDESFYEKNFAQNKIQAYGVLKSEQALDGFCSYTTITQEDMQKFGVDSHELDGIVEQLRITKGVECAIFLYETETGAYKVSMRANSKINVSEIASYFGGGGHVRAAGFTKEGESIEIVNLVIQQIKLQMKEWKL